MNTSDIDRLVGRELDEAVAIELGWVRRSCGTWFPPNCSDWRDDQGDYRVPYYSCKVDFAIEKLASLDNVQIDFRNETISVFRPGVGTVASGPAANRTAIMCRAFLKLKATQ